MKISIIKLISAVLLFAVTLTLFSCTLSQIPDDSEKNPSVEVEETTFTGYDTDAAWSASDAVTVNLNGNSAEISGDGAEFYDGSVYITVEGTYIISGTLDDGNICVHVAKDEKVRLVLNDVDITCSDSAAINITSSDKVVITLADGTNNILTDGKSYRFAAGTDEPNACVFSKDDLTINGNGSLTVNGKYNNGICSKDDLKIVSGSITVNAKNHGLRGNDSVSVLDGDITVSASNDGIKSTTTDDPTKGYIHILGGTLSVVSGDDAFQAVSEIEITGGMASVRCGGDRYNCDGKINVTVEVSEQ